MLARGVHDKAAGGRGLGLHISRRLVASPGGVLALQTVSGSTGCLVSVSVPAAPPAAALDRSPTVGQPPQFHRP